MKSITIQGSEIVRDNGSGYSLAQAFPGRRFRRATWYKVEWNGIQLDASTVVSIKRSRSAALSK